MHDDPKPRCKAKRRDGQRCTNAPINGATVCRMHGGSNPQLKAKIERQRIEDTARKLVARFGEPVTGSDPIAVLHERLDTQVGVVAWIEAQLKATPAHLSGMVALVEDFHPGLLPQQPAEAGVAVQGDGPALLVREEHVTFGDDGETRKVVLKANPLMQMYATERDRLVNLCLKMVEAGFQKKLVDARVAEVRLALAPVVELLRELVDDERLVEFAPLLRQVIAEKIAARRELVT